MIVGTLGVTSDMKASLIGCGLIGRKRVEAFEDNLELVGVFDLNKDNSKEFANSYGAHEYLTEKEIFEDESTEIIFIATRHDKLAQLAMKALAAGKHVFVEKPGAINYSEMKILSDLASSTELRVHVGYNHRYHPALQMAYEIFNSGKIGPLMFVRGRYGHGGRIGYEKEWRADRLKSGGGELIDQGTHLLDLSFGFLGDLNLEYSATPTYFWDMEVEDNAFISVSNTRGNLAFLQASCTEWKNMFSLEIYCKTGKLEILGLGRSYGMETLTLHKMAPEMGIPTSTTWSFPESDESWGIEIQEFVNDIQTNSGKSNNLKEALSVLKIVEQIYARGSK